MARLRQRRVTGVSGCGAPWRGLWKLDSRLVVHFHSEPPHPRPAQRFLNVALKELPPTAAGSVRKLHTGWFLVLSTLTSRLSP